MTTEATEAAEPGDVPPRDDYPSSPSIDALQAASWASDDADDDYRDMKLWVVELAGQPEVSLFRCDCTKWWRRLMRRKCDYHRANWQLILDVVLGAFRAEFGDGPVERGLVLDCIEPHIELLLRGRRHQLERLFAASLLTDPVYAVGDQWANGQHRSHAARQAGATHILFGG